MCVWGGGVVGTSAFLTSEMRQKKFEKRNDTKLAQDSHFDIFSRKTSAMRDEKAFRFFLANISILIVFNFMHL